MTLSYVRNRLKSVVAPLAVVLLVMGLGWVTLHFLFGPHVARVDPAVLSELRAMGRIVGEDSTVGHEWENSYVEMNNLVVYLDGNAQETHMSSELREQVASTGLPTNNMVYIGVQP